MKTFLVPIIEYNLDLNVARWLVVDGEWVEKGQELVELECEKADLSKSAPVPGILRHRAAVSEEVLAGELIGEIESAEAYTPESEVVQVFRQSDHVRVENEADHLFWTFNDGWILAAIAAASDPKKKIMVHLKSILMFGDLLNHAILSPNELSQSLTKLIQHGIVDALNQEFVLVHKLRVRIIASVGDICPVTPIINATKWLNETSSFVINTLEIHISEKEHHAAYEAYTDSIK